MDIDKTLTSKVMLEAFNRLGTTGSLGTVGDFVAGAAYMAELFAQGQGSLRETLEAIRNDLRLLNAQQIRADRELKNEHRSRMRVYDSLAADHPLVKTDEHRCAKCHELFEPGAHVTLIPVDPGGQGGTVAALPAHAQCIEELTKTSLEKDS